MQLIRGWKNIPPNFSGCALTIGNFDGVHLGHQAILLHLRAKADELGLPMAVLLFEPQPREFFQGQNAPARLMRLRDKFELFSQFGVDYLICIRFNQAFSTQRAEQFILNGLVNKLHVKFLSIGDDFRFGAERQGDFAMLQQFGKQYGFTVEDNHSFCQNALRVSSTAIRQALADGNLTQAEQLLGHPYSIIGKVIHGNKLGRTIGFPTANIRLQRQVNPIQGVYAVKVQLPTGELVNGVANVGKRPTVNGIKQLLEVHLFDFERHLYGQNLSVIFCHKLRDEMKFPSLEALKAQIAQDAQDARFFFQQKG